MARLKEGFLGAFQGVLGTGEGYIRKGVPMVRAKKRKSKKKATPKQLAQRQKMKVVNDFIKTMTPFVATGFELIAQNETFTANNAAKSYQMLYALEGEYPDISINYSAAVLTKGTLAPPNNPTATALENGVQFNWDFDAEVENELKRDQVMMLVHAPQLEYNPNEKKEKSIFSLSGARRKDGTDTLELPAYFKNTALRIYIAMIADDRKSISDSIYIGELTLI